MKKTTIIPSIFIIFVIATLLQSCSQLDQDNEWKAVTRKEDGTTIISNPKTPKYGEVHLDLVENLSIGNDDDSDYQFYLVSGILLDEEDNIYVLDSGNCRIQKFDRSGKHLQTMGRKGPGPGEFTNPSAFYIDGESTLYVADQMKIEVFDSAGEYKKSIPLETRINEFIVTSEGQIITYTILDAEEGNKKAIVKLNLEGKIIENMAEFTDVRALQSKTDTGRTMTFKAYHQYNYWPYLYPEGNDGFVYAYPSEYKIFNTNSKGELSLVIQKDIAPKAISQEEKNFIMNNIRKITEKRGIKITDDLLKSACQFPPHRPFFNWILLDDAERLYVREAGSVLDRNPEFRIDIFNKNGYYLYRTSFPFTPELIRRGHVYDVFTSEDSGEVEIRRYRINNWGELEK
jgi:hypothetical protein